MICLAVGKELYYDYLYTIHAAYLYESHPGPEEDSTGPFKERARVVARGKLVLPTRHVCPPPGYRKPLSQNKQGLKRWLAEHRGSMVEYEDVQLTFDHGHLPPHVVAEAFPDSWFLKDEQRRRMDWGWLEDK